MTDVFSKKKRSEIMSLIKSKDTKAELKFRSLLSKEIYPLGFRYRKNYRRLPGSPDIVFVKYKIAIFIDGDFWHGRNFEKRRKKLSKEYWRPKILKNIERDLRINKILKRKGWKIFRFWESDFNKKPDFYVRKVIKKLLVAEH